MSVRTISQSVHRFMWVARTSRARTMRWPARVRRYPSSMSSIAGRRIEPGVEPAELEEELAANHPAAGPEGMGRPGVVDERSVLVDEMMEQVAVLADQARRGRCIVVGAEEGREARVGLEPRHGAAQGLGVDGDVGVEEEDQGG